MPHPFRELLLRRSALVVLATAALLVQGCGGGAGPDAPDRNLAFSIVENTAFSAVTTRRLLVVNDDVAWAALWAQHKALVTPLPARPAIDFLRETVAAIFLGEVASCNRPRVDAVVETPGVRITVRWTHVPPQPNEACAAVVVHPVQMVRFDNPLRLPVEFSQAP